MSNMAQQMPVLSPDVGRKLREARERRSLSLSDAGETTRIKISQLEAMERNDFSVFAAPIYARGFLRTYATFLGLDYTALSAPPPVEVRPEPVAAPIAPGPSVRPAIVPPQREPARPTRPLPDREPARVPQPAPQRAPVRPVAPAPEPAPKPEAPAAVTRNALPSVLKPAVAMPQAQAIPRSTISMPTPASAPKPAPPSFAQTPAVTPDLPLPGLPPASRPAEPMLPLADPEPVPRKESEPVLPLLDTPAEPKQPRAPLFTPAPVEDLWTATPVRTENTPRASRRSPESPPPTAARPDFIQTINPSIVAGIVVAIGLLIVLVRCTGGHAAPTPEAPAPKTDPVLISPPIEPFFPIPTTRP